MSTRFFSPRSADLHADLNLNVSVKAVFVLNARTTIYPAASNTRILFFIYIFSHTHIVFAASVCGHKAFQMGCCCGRFNLMCAALGFSLEKDG